MAKHTIADYLAKTLAAAGVERIWGVTGDSLNGLAYSLDQIGSIRWMHTRHEESRRFCGGRRRGLDRPARRMRRQLRPRQPAPDQRTVRLPSQPSTRARDRGAYSIDGNRAWLLSGDASSGAVQGMQPLRRARLERRSSFLACCARDAHGHRERGVAVIVLPGDVALERGPDGSRVWSEPAPPSIVPAEADLERLADLLNASRSGDDHVRQRLARRP